ncbi:MAG: hypothetical protein RR988_04795 [Clostridia bacterium]
MNKKYINIKSFLFIVLLGFLAMYTLKNLMLLNDSNCNLHTCVLGLDLYNLKNFSYLSYSLFVNFAMILIIFIDLKRSIKFNRDFYILRMNKNKWIISKLLFIFQVVVFFSTYLSLLYIIFSGIYDLQYDISVFFIYFINGMLLRYILLLIISVAAILINKYITTIYISIALIPLLSTNLEKSFLGFIYLNTYNTVFETLFLLSTSVLCAYISYMILNKNILKIYEMR